MYARMNTARWREDTYDEAMKLTEETIIPAYQNHPGYQGYLLLTDGDKGVAVTLWDSEENRESSNHIAQRMIGELKGILAEPPLTENFDVTFDVWQSERALHDAGDVKETLSALEAKGYIEHRDNAVWLKTTPRLTSSPAACSLLTNVLNSRPCSPREPPAE